MKNAHLTLITRTGDGGAVILPCMGADVAAHVRWMELQNLAQNSIKLRTTVLGLLTRHTGKPLGAVTARDMESWQDSIACLAAETRLAYISAIRCYYRWAHANRRVEYDPSDHLIVPKVVRGLPHPVSERTLEWTLGHAPMPLRIWFEFAAYAGLRACEIAAVERPDITDDHASPAVLVHGKGSRERAVPLAPHLLGSLHDMGMPRRGRLFNATAHSVSERCNRWLHRHGIDDTLHAYRHRFATELYEASGHDLVLVQQLMGHASIKTTTVYTLVRAQAGAAAVARIDRPLLRLVQDTGS